ncbi:MAG: hypothetical protein KME50_16135 [Nostoc desertorum CM1-VF14]|jgi:hypothetical protein|nr:hypothetical protein [Nostoc desertorum CM1-VF14]
MPLYEITFFHPHDDEPDTSVIYANDIEKSFVELQHANPKVEFLSYRKVEDDDDEEEEIQLSNEGCWQFLDCQTLTGVSADKCPNAKACKQNALHSHNRSCSLPYQKWLPELDQLWDVPTLWVDWEISPEAQEAGYGSPEDLFYVYKNSCLIIGEDERGYWREVPSEATPLGFSRAWRLPYKFVKGVLTVEIINNHRKFEGMGWAESLPLPYKLHHDLDTGKQFIRVQLDLSATNTQDAIDYGWHPGYTLLKP